MLSFHIYFLYCLSRHKVVNISWIAIFCTCSKHLKQIQEVSCLVVASKWIHWFVLVLGCSAGTDRNTLPTERFHLYNISSIHTGECSRFILRVEEFESYPSDILKKCVLWAVWQLVEQRGKVLKWISLRLPDEMNSATAYQRPSESGWSSSQSFRAGSSNHKNEKWNSRSFRLK